MKKFELESQDQKKRYVPIAVGKLSPQNSVKIPSVICNSANWINGDSLMFYLDKESGNVVIVNDTLNETFSPQVQFFNQNLSEKFNDSCQLTIIEADAFNDSHPLKLLKDYVKEYSGYLNFNDQDLGKIHLTEKEVERMQREVEKEKDSNDKKQYQTFTQFLNEYTRKVKSGDLPGAYIFYYHHLECDEVIEEVKDILQADKKVILWGYHNVNNVLEHYLRKLKVDEYYYLKYTTGEDIVEKKKTANSENVLVANYH